MDPEKIYDKMVRAGEEWSDAQAAAELLEETRKSVLARLMTECSMAAFAGKEMMALADPEYEKFVKGMVQARRAANKARVKYDSAKVWVELLRSQEATRRAEANIR